MTKNKQVRLCDLVDRYESQMEFLRALVRPLKGFHTKRILGETGYHELILLKGVEPGTAVTVPVSILGKRKRDEKEGGPGTALQPK